MYVGRARKKDPVKGRQSDKGPPPMKRLRLRGDWSDTGPNARPENEVSPQQVRTPEPRASSSAEEDEQPRNQAAEGAINSPIKN